MKQDSMKVLFFIRKSRLKKNGEALVFLLLLLLFSVHQVLSGNLVSCHLLHPFHCAQFFDECL